MKNPRSARPLRATLAQACARTKAHTSTQTRARTRLAPAILAASLLALCLSALCLSPVFSAPPDTTTAAPGSHRRGARPPFPEVGPALFAAKYRAVATFKADSIPQDYVAIGSARGYVYVLKKTPFAYADSWNTFNLGAPIKKILADDIDADGVAEILVLTTAGKMYIFDTATHQRVWESSSNDFDNASEFVVDQLDPDVEKEIVLCADSQIIILDGETLLREYQSADQYSAEYMVIGDVDNDDEKEIVLDSGFVINGRTLNMEWQTDFFGTRLSLVDVDDDRVPELISESNGGAIRVYDLDIRQEKTVF